MSFEREVGVGEKFLIAFNEQRPPFIIQLAIEIDGEPEPEALDDALERAAAANPGSSLRLDEDRRPETWVLGPRPPLTLFDAPDWDGHSEEDAPFLRWPIDCNTGPTCELVFVRGKNHNYLVFRAAHAVMDGQGTIAWVKDVLRCLRGEAPIGHDSPLIVDTLVRQLKAKKRASHFPDALHPFGLPNNDAPGGYLWRRLRFSRPLDSAITARVAVALAEQARKFGEGNFRLNLPTDLRHYRPEERTTGNMFNSLFVEIPPGATVEAVGLKILGMLYKHEGTKPFGNEQGEDRASLNACRVKVLWDLAHLHDTGRYTISTTLSHLGALRSADFSAPEFQARGVFFVPLISDSGCVVSVNGFDEGLEVCVGLSDRFSGSGQIDILASIVSAAISAG